MKVRQNKKRISKSQHDHTTHPVNIPPMPEPKMVTRDEMYDVLAPNLDPKNPDLKGVDPHSPDLTPEQKLAIAQECKENPSYFVREVLRAPVQARHIEHLTIQRGVNGPPDVERTTISTRNISYYEHVIPADAKSAETHMIELGPEGAKVVPKNPDTGSFQHAAAIVETAREENTVRRFFNKLAKLIFGDKKNA